MLISRKWPILLLACFFLVVLLVGGGLLYLRTHAAREQVRALVEERRFPACGEAAPGAGATDQAGVRGPCTPPPHPYPLPHWGRGKEGGLRILLP